MGKILQSIDHACVREARFDVKIRCKIKRSDNGSQVAKRRFQSSKPLSSSLRDESLRRHGCDCRRQWRALRQPTSRSSFRRGVRRVRNDKANCRSEYRINPQGQKILEPVISYWGAACDRGRAVRSSPLASARVDFAEVFFRRG